MHYSPLNISSNILCLLIDRVGDAAGDWSDIFSFTTPPAVGDDRPMRYGVIGDLGQTSHSRNTVQHLMDDGTLQTIIHAGEECRCNYNCLF